MYEEGKEIHDDIESQAKAFRAFTGLTQEASEVILTDGPTNEKYFDDWVEKLALDAEVQIQEHLHRVKGLPKGGEPTEPAGGSAFWEAGLIGAGIVITVCLVIAITMAIL